MPFALRSVSRKLLWERVSLSPPRAKASKAKAKDERSQAGCEAGDCPLSIAGSEPEAGRAVREAR